MGYESAQRYVSDPPADDFDVSQHICWAGYICGCLSVGIKLTARLREIGVHQQEHLQTASEYDFVCT